jgi:hypothetical protein
MNVKMGRAFRSAHPVLWETLSSRGIERQHPTNKNARISFLKRYFDAITIYATGNAKCHVIFYEKGSGLHFLATRKPFP